MEPKFLGIRKLAAVLDISKSKLYEHLAMGDFPSPCAIGGCRRWNLEEVISYFKLHPQDRKAHRSHSKKGAAR